MGNITQVSTRQLSVHHITPVDRAPDKAYDDDNLLTLCIPCHHIYTELEGAGKYSQSIADGHMVRTATVKKFW